MTELVRNQINIICVMCLCGVALGIVNGVLGSFEKSRQPGNFAKVFLRLTFYLCAGFLTGEAMYFCNQGKVTFLAASALLCGLLLWKKIFCDILTPIGGENGEEKG